VYNKIPGGTTETLWGKKCWIPPVGKVWNYFTGELEESPVVSRSEIKSEQYWQREPLPPDWSKRRIAERARQAEDPEYFDPKLEEFRTKMWHRRLFGMWFMNNGNPTYITGTHQLYMNWWTYGAQYPDYRDTDRQTFYFWEYVWFDPNSAGITEIAGRRDGKTMRATCAMYEKISRNANANGGIQSKTSKDASKVFEKMISSFIKMPDFFRPEYDETKGHRPKGELAFFATARKGKRANNAEETKAELESRVDWRSSDRMAYDGERLLIKVNDEEGKTTEEDVWERHLVDRYCLEVGGSFVGKKWSTTTVEDMIAGGASYFKLWENSNQEEVDENGRTKSWLYRIFKPAFKSMLIDKYGIADEEKAKQFLLNERKGLADDPRSLSSIIRKKPFTPEEAFRIDGSKCMYDAMRLNAQLDIVSWQNNLVQRGSFEWENGIKDTKVIWNPSANGKYLLAWNFDKEEQTNKVVRRGTSCSPGNDLRFVMGVDPYDHDVTEDNVRSLGAGAVLKRHDPTLDDNNPFNRSFVCLYLHRPDTSDLFYEDMIKMAVYFGCGILAEDNKYGIFKYFEARGYSDFMIWFEDREKPGISASKNSHQTLADVTEAYIKNCCHKTWFKVLIDQWLKFDINKTTKFDAAMAAGYALIADTYKVDRTTSDEVYDYQDFFNIN